MSAVKKVEELIAKNAVLVFSKTYCGYCGQAKALLEKLNTSYTSVELDVDPEGKAMSDYLVKKTKRTTVPNIYIKQQNIGGCDDLMRMHRDGKLMELLK